MTTWSWRFGSLARPQPEGVLETGRAWMRSYRWRWQRLARRRMRLRGGKRLRRALAAPVAPVVAPVVPVAPVVAPVVVAAEAAAARRRRPGAAQEEALRRLGRRSWCSTLILAIVMATVRWWWRNGRQQDPERNGSGSKAGESLGRPVTHRPLTGLFAQQRQRCARRTTACSGRLAKGGDAAAHDAPPHIWAGCLRLPLSCLRYTSGGRPECESSRAYSR